MCPLYNGMGCQSDHKLYTAGANGDSIDIMCFQASKPQVQSGADTALQIIQTLMWSDIRSDTIELTMWAAQYTHMHVHTYIHTCLTLHTHIIYTYICSVQYACAVLHTYVRRTMWRPSTYGYSALK